MKIPFLASVSATVAAGRAVGRLSPGVAGSRWTIERMVTSTTLGPTVPANLVVYKNVESPTTRLDGTSSAGQDTSETNIDIDSSDSLVAVWTGVANGTVCTLTVSGINDTGR